MRTKSDVKKIMAVLDKEYPDVKCSLDHKNPLQLLVATILSAQCTDERVNIVTKALFKKYKKSSDYAEANLKELEEDVRSTGFFRNKAKNIKELNRVLTAKYKGQVPKTQKEMVELPGVGRKTANVVLATAYGIPGITVDTHVGRLSQRLGLTENKDPVKIEFDLMEQIPKEQWDRFSLQLIAHGRAVCQSRKPQCPLCPLLKLCPFGNENSA